MVVTNHAATVPRYAVHEPRVSLFVIPTFRTSSSTLLEAAVALGQGNTTSTIDRDGAGSVSASPENGDDVPRNASHLESQGTVNGWSLSDTQSSEGRSVEWEACRYYEVGDIREGVQTVISHPALGEEGIIFVKPIRRACGRLECGTSRNYVVPP